MVIFNIIFVVLIFYFGMGQGDYLALALALISAQIAINAILIYKKIGSELIDKTQRKEE